jgi:hypothetical protein
MANGQSEPVGGGFQAYQMQGSLSAESRKKLVEALNAAGVKPVESYALDHHRILAFETPSGVLEQKVSRLVSGLKAIPVLEYKGIFSVHTGYFFLQFKNSVPLETARKRILDAGFRIASPRLEPRTFIVVERSRLPENRDAELEMLKKLPDLLYVSPDDVPLQVSPPAVKK